MFKKLIVLICIMMTVVAYGGHETGNGGNYKDFFSDNAWFVEDRPVQYCLKRNEKFVSNIADVLAATKRSLNKWIEFLKKISVKNENYPIQNNFIYNDR